MKLQYLLVHLIVSFFLRSCFCKLEDWIQTEPISYILSWSKKPPRNMLSDSLVSFLVYRDVGERDHQHARPHLFPCTSPTTHPSVPFLTLILLFSLRSCSLNPPLSLPLLLVLPPTPVSCFRPNKWVLFRRSLWINNTTSIYFPTKFWFCDKFGHREDYFSVGNLSWGGN